jgi:hypothetical protein
LIEKIRGLPPDKVLEVEDFIDFINQRNLDRELTYTAARLSEKAFKKVWDNPEDAAYDLL